MEAGEGAAIKEKYRVRGYPTFLFLDPDGNEINRFMGLRDLASFMEIARLSLDPADAPRAYLNAKLQHSARQNTYTQQRLDGM